MKVAKPIDGLEHISTILERTLDKLEKQNASIKEDKDKTAPSVKNSRMKP